MTHTIEVRRHSYTKKGQGRGRGSHLSVEGVQLARRLGETMGPFKKVLASDVPRTLETAMAMGFPVDEVLPFPDAVEWEAVIEELGWHSLWEVDEPFAHVARSLPQWPRTARMGEHYARAWLETASSLSGSGSALVVSHGQLMEVAIVTCFPDTDHARWGPPFSHCEGARLTVEDGTFTDVELLRVTSTAT